jgi:hypothetical protein
MSKNNSTNQPSSVPINVIFLDKSIQESRDEIISDYIDILKTCRTAQEFYCLFEQFYDDVVFKTSSWIIEKQIQKHIEILEEIKKVK